MRQPSDADACLAFAQRARGALDGFTAVSSLDAQDEELSRVVAKIRQLVAEAHENLSREIGAIESHTHWGELVVSFFGETNAGKSTIVEALIGGRGTTIGDGTKDFTREVTEYKIDVGTGAPVVLLDMPGVEGVEERVRDAIGAAVGRSHAVFVVVGSKEPERGLLERIRGWLAEQAAVYAVVNARQAPRDPMPPLESAGNVEVRERTRSLLGRELGGFFHGVALVNGKIAFLASAGDLEPRFASAEEKVARTFLSRQHALGYSGLATLRREISDLARAAPERALVANAFKLLSVVQKTSASLLREKKRFDGVVKKAEGQLARARSRIGAAVEQAKASAQHAVDLTFRQLETELVEEVYAAVDKGEDPKKVTQRLQTRTQKRSSDLEERIQQITTDLEKTIGDELSILDARLQIDVKGIERGGLIDMQKILKELRIGLRYVAGQIADVVLKVIGVIGALVLGPVVAIVAGALAALGKLLDWLWLDPAKRKREAKAKALERIETSMATRRSDARAHLARELERMRQEVEEQLDHAQQMLDDLHALGRRFGQQLEGLLAVDAELGTYVVRRIAGPEVEAAYVDLQRGTCVIGPRPSAEQLRTLNQPRCLAAPSFEGLVEAAGFERSGDWLLAPADTDELLVRMLRAYPDQARARGVRRKSR